MLSSEDSYVISIQPQPNGNKLCRRYTCSLLLLRSIYYREGVIVIGESSLRLQPCESGLESFNKGSRLVPVHYLKAYMRRKKEYGLIYLLFIFLRNTSGILDYDLLILLILLFLVSMITIASWVRQDLPQQKQRNKKISKINHYFIISYQLQETGQEC